MAHKKIFSDGKLVIWSDGSATIGNTEVPSRYFSYLGWITNKRVARETFGSSPVILSIIPGSEYIRRYIKHQKGCLSLTNQIPWDKIPDDEWVWLKVGDPNKLKVKRISRVLSLGSNNRFVVCLVDTGDHPRIYTTLPIWVDKNEQLCIPFALFVNP